MALRDVTTHAGSISALGIDVSIYYKLGSQSDSEVKKNTGSLIFIDVQYLGNQDVNVFLEGLKNPKPNSIFITPESNVEKVICSNTGTKDGVSKYFESFQPDTLCHYYDDYDEILDQLVTKEMVAGSVTKVRRLPVISIYTNTKPLTFLQVLSDRRGMSLSRENTKNFIVYSGSMKESSPHMYIIGSTSNIEYKHSYIINPSTMKLVKVTNDNVLNNYKKQKDSDLIINGCDFVQLLKDAVSDL